MKAATVLSGLSVYLVEDSDLLASRILDTLENEPGVRVVGRSAEAGDAIAQIARLEPDLAIIDLSLRQGTGFDVLRAVASSMPSPLCIVLSNHSSPEYRRAAEQMGLGPGHFFDKTEQLPSCMRLVRSIAEQKLAAAETEASDGREHEQDDGSRSRQGARRSGNAQVRH